VRHVDGVGTIDEVRARIREAFRDFARHNGAHA
jgi:hypothetical protein